MRQQHFTTTIAGKELHVSVTDLAGNAHGSVMLRTGETVVLVTAVRGKENPSLPYFPLSVEFEEKFYAAGEILGSRFMRREGRPSDEAILAARLVDRTIRPLFPLEFRTEVQVVVTVLAVGEDDPHVLGVLGASLALSLSDIPWHGPIGAVRILQTREGEIRTNPTYTERAEGGTIELFACGKDACINMIETVAEEQSEDTLTNLLHMSAAIHTEQISFQQSIIATCGTPKISFTPKTPEPEIVQYFENNFRDKLTEAIFSNQSGKDHIYAVIDAFRIAATEQGYDERAATGYGESQVDHLLHYGGVVEKRRADGRGFDDVRPLFAQAGGISPVLHGSGIFYRGETHIFTALTLGGPEAAQLIDTMEERSVKKRFMHHYNFPPFSVGESGRVGGFNRRMIGHGALAEKALLPVIPPQQEFPYTIRLVSETMMSNGSSSMGSVCASSLALMDGGVPIKRPVAGIASGVLFFEGAYQLLTDIQGPEDEFGDMDFKVAGTTEGITAIQMDVKVGGIPIPVLREALEKARDARLTILKTLTEAIAIPRAHISPRAPEIISLSILPEQIGLVIGSGGKTINGIKEATGVEEITIEEDGTVFISGKNGSATKAHAHIAGLTKRYAIGEKTTATITRITTFGAFASLNQFHEGLIHISEIVPQRLEKVEDVLQVGEEVPVIVIKSDEGKIGLSIKQADPVFAQRKLPRSQ